MRALLGAIAVALAVHATGIAVAADDAPLPTTVPALIETLGLSPLDGRPAPAFSLSDADGRQVSLTDLRGRVLLLYFWASW